MIWGVSRIDECERRSEEKRSYERDVFVADDDDRGVDANWLSLQAELAEASVLVGDATFAATLYERLTPYAGRPVTAGRAICSYGAVDRLSRRWLSSSVPMGVDPLGIDEVDSWQAVSRGAWG